jgi:hypothetical protein
VTAPVPDGAEVVDLAAKRRAKHEAAPRVNEGLYRYGVLKGYAGSYEPMSHEYPLKTICTCGKTIERKSPDEPWDHFQW